MSLLEFAQSIVCVIYIYALLLLYVDIQNALSGLHKDRICVKQSSYTPTKPDSVL